MARSVCFIDADGKIVYRQIVSELTDEPDYDAALSALKKVTQAWRHKADSVLWQQLAMNEKISLWTIFRDCLVGEKTGLTQTKVARE